MQVPFGNLRAHYLAQKPAIDEAVRRVLDSGWFILGKEVEAFEQAFAAYVRATYCVGVANGTDAIEIALRALGIGPGDEVITVSHTATFTALGITGVGATPVFVDVNEATYTMDPDLLESAITPRTKAIMPVHLYGFPAELDPIMAIAARHGISVIEDAAQAHGARYKGNAVGSIGTIGCFSFYPSKNLGAFGDGGATVTSNPELATKLAMIRNGGQSNRYHHNVIGVNSRLDELQAAILRVELDHLDADNARRAVVANYYSDALHSLGIALPPAGDVDHVGVNHLYAIRVKDREQVRQRLQQRGIATQVHYPIPAHKQPPFAVYARGALLVTERVANEIVSLPIYPEIPLNHVHAVVQALRSVLGNAS